MKIICLLYFLFIIGYLNADICFTCLSNGQTSTDVSGLNDCVNLDQQYNGTLKGCQNKPTLSQSCDQSHNCISGYSCKDNVCQDYYYQQIGGDCKEDLECNSLYCLNGKCTVPDAGCTVAESDCGFDKYCYENQCVPRIQVGQTIPGGISYGCVNGAGNLAGGCVKYQSLNENDSCEAPYLYHYCNASKGLYCDNSQCVKYVPTTEICTDPMTSVANTCNNNEYCSCETNKCVTMENTDTQCYSALSNLFSCLETNKCDGSLRITPSSCVIKKCGKPYCQTLKCQGNGQCRAFPVDICSNIPEDSSSSSKESTDPSSSTKLKVSLYLSQIILLIFLVILN